MKKLIKYIFIFYSTVAFSQNATILYTLKNTCKELSVGRIVAEKYYKGYTTLVESNKEYSTEGKFDLNVNDKFPLPYSLMCGQKEGNFIPSALFTVSNGNLNFVLDSIGFFVQPLPVNNKNPFLLKDQYKFKDSFSKLPNVFLSKGDDDVKADKLLVKYSKENPDSYMLFWTLVQNFEYKGFRESYLVSFKNLLSKIRNSEYGKMFYNDLINSTKLDENVKFPNLEFQNKRIFSSLGKKYTLIDFWFSSCKPCLEQIPAYKKIYSKYKENGFEIVNISSDRTEDIPKWKKLITEKELNWVHFLDENGVLTKRYNINKYPTTFLLDSEGKIIKKDITTEELDRFLKENIK